MPNRARTAVLLTLATQVCVVCLAGAGLAQLSERRGPPWTLPVASSRLIHTGNATVQVDFAPGALDLPAPEIMQWVENAVSSVATYYGRFPVRSDRIVILPRPDAAGVMHGTTWGGVDGFPAFTRISLGQHSTLEDLNNDWMMTHELVHTGFPSQEDAHHWIEEGLAVYVEPVARVQTGFLEPEKIWSDMVRDMPRGDPPAGDEGLDRTHSWGLTYWGGAQFCLLADVTIREQTHNRRGLQDALRAIVAAGGTIDQNWPLMEALRRGDEATGTHVLEDEYQRMAETAVQVDLDAIWKKLGVIRTSTGVRLDDRAPEAAIRLAITQPPASGRIMAAPQR